MLKNKFLPALRRRGLAVQDVWFQQDGASPHTARNVVAWLEETFGENFISFKTGNVWPPHSPDLSPLDFYLWGYLKDRVYTPPPETLAELKTAIRREIRGITPETCASVISNFHHRLDIVSAQKGRHLEHIRYTAILK